ncbi:GyrI-like domain-containing protein [Micromonospora sonneratiae]|uniref:GyrI-like domain-containing protein n=1 Tax=Micromonospora sonneratiae TaxID=1184706 RepID=A0ABW3YGV5_9ACTN
MLSTDFKKVHKDLYGARTEPALVDVPPLRFLAVDGAGDPDGPVWRAAVEALYGVSYFARFALKNAGVVEYPVMPLQGLWWVDGGWDITERDRADWRWTMMIMQPPQVTADLVAQGIATTAKKKPSAAVDRLELREYAEGPSAQILHIGPYAAERPTIERLLAYVAEQGRQVCGRHHEIYLSNPSRTAPEKLKTIIRYPVTPPPA